MVKALFMNCFLKVSRFFTGSFQVLPVNIKGLAGSVATLAGVLACNNDCKLAHDLEQCRSPSLSRIVCEYMCVAHDYYSNFLLEIKAETKKKEELEG
jgi:hypothetical protein